MGRSRDEWTGPLGRVFDQTRSQGGYPSSPFAFGFHSLLSAGTKRGRWMRTNGVKKGVCVVVMMGVTALVLASCSSGGASNNSPPAAAAGSGTSQTTKPPVTATTQPPVTTTTQPTEGSDGSSTAQGVATQFIDDVASGQSSSAIGLTFQGSAGNSQSQQVVATLVGVCSGTMTVQMAGPAGGGQQADFEPASHDGPCQGEMLVGQLGQGGGWLVFEVIFNNQTFSV